MIRAQRFELLDASGNIRALLRTVKGDRRYGMGDDMPMLVFFNEAGWPDIVLGVMRLQSPRGVEIMDPKPALRFCGGGNTVTVVWRAP